MKKLGEGCYTSLSYARGPLFWYFDGAHRNVTMVDVDTSRKWMVNLTNAPGFESAEASHPRWTNHPRFLTITGPYNQGGPNQSRTGGKQTEVYVGRFSADFSKVEGVGACDQQFLGRFASGRLDRRRTAARIRDGRAARRARERGGQRRDGRRRRAQRDSRAPRAQRPPGAAGADPHAEGDPALPARAGRQRIRNRGGVQGTYAEREIHIAQWAIRDGRVLAGARKSAGAGFTLTVERYDAHAELEGERLISEQRGIQTAAVL